jgi:hypothetical protein
MRLIFDADDRIATLASSRDISASSRRRRSRAPSRIRATVGPASAPPGSVPSR